LHLHTVHIVVPFAFLS